MASAISKPDREEFAASAAASAAPKGAFSRALRVARLKACPDTHLSLTDQAPFAENGSLMPRTIRELPTSSILSHPPRFRRPCRSTHSRSIRLQLHPCLPGRSALIHQEQSGPPRQASPRAGRRKRTRKLPHRVFGARLVSQYPTYLRTAG